MLSAKICPPIISTSFFVRFNPRPVPSILRLRLSSILVNMTHINNQCTNRKNAYTISACLSQITDLYGISSQNINKYTDHHADNSHKVYDCLLAFFFSDISSQCHHVNNNKQYNDSVRNRRHLHKVHKSPDLKNQLNEDISC